MRSGLSLGNFTALYLRAEDKMRKWRRRHQKKLYVKKTPMMKFYKRLRDGGIQLAQDIEKELSYGSGMMGPGLKMTTTSRDGRQALDAPIVAS
jgi:hypothetical protein